LYGLPFRLEGGVASEGGEWRVASGEWRRLPEQKIAKGRQYEYFKRQDAIFFIKNFRTIQIKIRIISKTVAIFKTYNFG
jgi:hypothetical protein